MPNKPSSPDQTLCLHHNDSDGRACAAVVRRALGPQVRLHEITYGPPIPWDSIEDAGRVIIADFSLPRADMERVARSRELIWIDHHISAIEDCAGISDNWLGLRDLSEAACVLTWRYFFPSLPLPRALVLIGDRDIWRLAEPDSAPFGEGLFHQRSWPDNDDLWIPLLDGDSVLVQRLIKEGQVLLDARRRNIRRTVARYGFPVLFEGYPTLAVNSRGDGDMGQHVKDLGYAIAYCYVDIFQSGKLMTSVTLFADGVDVSVIAQKFGGGGHKGAAGFQFERGATPFPLEAKVSW